MRWAPAAALTALSLVAACTPDERPGRLGDLSSRRPAADSGLFELTDPGPPAADAPGLCGNLIIPIEVDRPNLYFVLDASGSMLELTEEVTDTGFHLTRYNAARFAIIDLLRVVGHRVSVGAAVFPGKSDELCPPGNEVFATRPGDPVSYAVSGEDGPILTGLLQTLGLQTPGGPTPTAATLVELRETILGLEGETFVFLLTDGAPNCNTAPCPISLCEPNILGLCPPTVNCCDPQNMTDGPLRCIDLGPTRDAIAELASSDVKTFVIGLPGSAFYEGVLGELAIAGLTARQSEPFYYPTSTAGEIGRTLLDLGTEIAIRCDVTLEEAPPDPLLVNVYFDDVVVPRDDDSGWRWVDDTTLRIVGEECDLLRSGQVLQLQVVAGCPSIVR